MGTFARGTDRASAGVHSTESGSKTSNSIHFLVSKCFFFLQYKKVGLCLQRLERPLSRLPRTTTGKARLRDVRLVAVIRRGHIVTGHVVDERVLNVVARDVVDCLEVFVPPPGAPHVLCVAH